MRRLLLPFALAGLLAAPALAEEVKPAAAPPAEAPKPPPPDEVKLKNGDRLTGTVKSLPAGNS